MRSRCSQVFGGTPAASLNRRRKVCGLIAATRWRWHQAFSRDGGKSWEDNWFMDWERI
jgi:hypothetical protein